MAKFGVSVIISMDNLDAMFHPPKYIEDYAAAFFIHAYGQQKKILLLISSLGVDGLEGVAFPPLCDIELDEAMKITNDKFIITGGINAHETSRLTSRKEIFDSTKNLLTRMSPFVNRFILSASCNTPINTSWEVIKHFRDAWLEYGDIR
jgi:uroporphyrinogen-III decarboxylase